MDRRRSPSQSHPLLEHSPSALRRRATLPAVSQNRRPLCRQRPASRPSRNNRGIRDRRLHRPPERQERSTLHLRGTGNSRCFCHQTTPRRSNVPSRHPPHASAPSESSRRPRPRASVPPRETVPPHTPPRADTPPTPYRALPSHRMKETPSCATTPWCRRRECPCRVDVVVRMRLRQSSRKQRQELCACHACYQALNGSYENCSRNRISPLYSSPISLIPYFIIAMLSTPIPKAMPLILRVSYAGSRPSSTRFLSTASNTAGSTIPHPSNSIQPECLHFR